MFYQVAFRELVFCFVSNEVELASLLTVAYACSLATLKLVEFPLNCQGSVNSLALEAKLNVNYHLFVACMVGSYSVCYIVLAQWLNCEKR